MTPKEKMHGFGMYMRVIRNKICCLNKACSDLNGAAATIPKGVQKDLALFTGEKVILRNVVYDGLLGAISAVIALPYLESNPPGQGRNLAVTIDESWFG